MWTDLLDYPIIGGVIETLNWLTISTPFFAGFAAFDWGQGSGNGSALPALVGVLAFLGLLAVWYVLYQMIQFPLWVSWFNR